MSDTEVICALCGHKTVRPKEGTSEPCEACEGLDFNLVGEDLDERIAQGPPDGPLDPQRLRVDFEVHPSYEKVVFRDAVWTVFPEEDPRWLLVWTPGGFHTFEIDTIEHTVPDVLA